jgi:hypothetical protein
VGIDRPDDADMPSEEQSGRSADRSDAPGDGGEPADRPGRPPAETRSREEYYEDLRAAAQEGDTEPRQTPAPEAAAEPTGRSGNGRPWEEVTAWSGRVWAEYQHRFPPGERPPVNRSGDPPGSWRGDGNQFLDRPVNETLEEECDHIADREEERISPALRATENCDPDRHLVGFEHRLKGRDRIKEKVAEGIEERGLSPKEAISLIPDAIRYTFQYEEARYSQSAQNDIVRLEERGFELIRLKNYWSGEQYKGINSQWMDPDTGQRFEVQFHTQISFEAKQITHDAYERLRSGQADEFEEMVLEAFQRKVSAEIPIPPGAEDIPDYP